MNITLLIDNFNCTKADREIIMDKYFPTDRCFRSFENGYMDSVWRNHISKYNSKITKLAIINFSDGYSFKRHLRDVVRKLSDEDLMHADVIEIDSNDEKKTKMTLFMQLIQEEVNRDKYFKLIDADPEDDFKFNERIAYLRSKY